MSVAVISKQEELKSRLLVSVLRPALDNERKTDPRNLEEQEADLRRSRRDKEELTGIPGEVKTVPFTITNVEGTGKVDYGTMTYGVNANNVNMTIHSVFGEHMSGVLYINQ